MCGRFNYGSDIRDVQAWTDLISEWPDIQSNFNVAPSAQIAVFRSGIGETMRWGMIAPWSKEFDSKYATFNARIETLQEKPTFRNAWRNAQRCLIPMSGYYEWKGEKGNKQPFYVSDPNVGIIVAAGLFEIWDETRLSCTMLTRPAANEIEHIHSRMPVMLNIDSANEWMNNKSGIDDLLKLDLPDVIFFPVSRAVGNTKNNSPDLITPLD